MVKQIWKPIKGWENLYEVSNYGIVKRLSVVTSNNIPLPEKVKKFEEVDGGYLRVSLTNRPRSEKFMVNRLVAAHFIPNPKKKAQVNHKLGNKKDNRSWMLEWATAQENMADAIKKGIKNNKLPKRNSIDTDTVLKIFNSQLSLGCLSKKFKLPKLTIQAIKSGKRYWKITGKHYSGRRY